jgi:hypothetical protein
MMKRKIFFTITIFSFLLLCCQHIETDDTLSNEQINYIRRIGLLDSDERIIKFYSEYRKKIAGNFFTNKRLAKFWIDEKDSSRNYKAFAYYTDIVSIDTNYMRNSLTYTPYLEVTKRDGTKFKVGVSGNKQNVRTFFEDAIARWKSSQRDLHE